MKEDGITAGESAGVVRIVFQSANVVPVFVDFSDEYPHSFSFLVSPTGIFGSETKEELYISSHFEIAPEFFRWRVNIVSVLPFDIDERVSLREACGFPIAGE